MQTNTALLQTPAVIVPDTRKVVVDIAGLNTFYSTFHVLHDIDLSQNTRQAGKVRIQTRRGPQIQKYRF